MTAKNCGDNAGDHGFADFWAAYPRREAVADARKAWRQTEAVRPPIADLLIAIRVHTRVNDWQPRDAVRRRYIPLAATWLRGYRWADELEVLAEDIVPVGFVVPPSPAEVEKRREAMAERSRAVGDAAMAKLRRQRAQERGAVQAVKSTAPAPVMDDLLAPLRRVG